MTQDNIAVQTLRGLSLDMIANANSGHPGMALSSAPIMYTLFTKHLIADPNHPDWINRDRFILSAGHASSLLYATLHLAGYKISLEDLKKFRKLNSLTPGHPEYRHTKGVDATSGPLGQGIAQAVGMAMAEAHLQAIYKQGEELINHYTYCLCGDGCLEEGLSQEAISLAGAQHLNKLILFYDFNKVTLDGPLIDSSIDDTSMRFKASGWNVLEVEDGNNISEIDKAIEIAKVAKNKPTLIIVNTTIGFGSPLAGSNKCHGKAYNKDEVSKTKENLGFPFEPFSINKDVYKKFQDTFITRGIKAYDNYQNKLTLYKEKHPEDYQRFMTVKDNDVSPYIFSQAPKYEVGFKDATRNTSGILLNSISKQLPNLFGGSADVAESVKTILNDTCYFSKEHREGKSIAFGIREFAMGCIQNGILLHGGLRSFVACFLVFADYLKPAIRMAAMEKIPAIYLFSHDSIAVGEDGPTHQPVEQLTMLRSIPNVTVIRPSDAIETSFAYNYAFSQTDRPTIIILSRQPLVNNINSDPDKCKKGAYIVSQEREKNEFTIIASGSEVNTAIELQSMLFKEGIDTRIVSMPSFNLFDDQDEEYKNSVLGDDYNKRIFIEMGKTDCLYKYAKYPLGIDTFGKSGKDTEVIDDFGFSLDKLYKKVRDIIKNQ